MNEFFLIVFALIMVFSLGENAVSAMWLPAYFRYGIPLFRKEYPLTTMPDLAAQIPELEQKLKRSGGRSSIVFRALDTHEIAFRNKFGTRDGISGLIRLEPNQRRMRISGNLYWSVLLIPVMFLAGAANGFISVFFAIFISAIFVMTFGRQRYQYGKIATVIRETAVSAEPLTMNNSEPSWAEPTPKTPDQPITYAPDFDPYQPSKPQASLNNTEITLLILLVALIVIAGVLAFLFLV
jgi:hypothetical protein